MHSKCVRVRKSRQTLWTCTRDHIRVGRQAATVSQGLGSATEPCENFGDMCLLINKPFQQSITDASHLPLNKRAKRPRLKRLKYKCAVSHSLDEFSVPCNHTQFRWDFVSSRARLFHKRYIWSLTCSVKQSKCGSSEVSKGKPTCGACL